MGKGFAIRMVPDTSGSHSNFVRDQKTAIFHDAKDRSKSRKRKSRKRHKKKRGSSPAMCDPAVCDNCVYVGEGGFACMRDPSNVAIVVDDWEPTDDYLICKR